MREDTVLLEEPTFITPITETYITTVQYCVDCIRIHLPYQEIVLFDYSCCIESTSYSKFNGE